MRSTTKDINKHTAIAGFGGTLRIIPRMPCPSISTSLYTIEQVRRLDQAAIAGGIPGFELMQRAASAAFALLRVCWPDARKVLVLAGNGNNGGDAFLVARLASLAGLDVGVVALGHESHGDAGLARAAWLESGGSITVADGSELPGDADVLVDGLFGTGLTRAPGGVAANLIERINAHRAGKLSLDVPSGLNADSGVAPGPVVRADATISFVGWKRGLFTADGVDCCGALSLDSLGISSPVFSACPGDTRLLDIGVLSVLPPRNSNVNKGKFGHVLAVGGDEGMGGAVTLCAEAALRVGAGLVSVATRSVHAGGISARRPELMVRGVEGPQSLEGMIERASVIALGPGMGQTAWGHALWDAALRASKPCVIDADGLNLLAREHIDLPNTIVLTPHPGEAARLLGCDVAHIQADRFSAVRELAKRYCAVVVLKGAGSLISNPGQEVALCPFGNPGMASGGMGDLLTGVIAGLLAQGLSAWDAAQLGVVAHALAGDHAAGNSPRGMIASDLLPFLRAFVNSGQA